MSGAAAIGADSGEEIHTGGPAPADPARNTEFHAELIDLLLAGARDRGWAGAEFCAYLRRNGCVSIGIKPGAGWPGIDDLRTFRTQNPPEPESQEQQERLL